MGDYFEEKAKQTDAELCNGYCGSLEPEYTRAHVIAEKVMAQFEAEHFKPILKKLSDHLTEHLWDLLRDNLIEDTEQNIAGHIRDRIETSIKALLSGQQWAIEKYALGKYDQEGVRKAIAAHIPKELQEKRMVELEEDNRRLRESLEFERRCRSGY